MTFLVSKILLVIVLCCPSCIGAQDNYENGKRLSSLRKHHVNLVVNQKSDNTGTRTLKQLLQHINDHEGYSTRDRFLEVVNDDKCNKCKFSTAELVAPYSKPSDVFTRADIGTCLTEAANKLLEVLEVYSIALLSLFLVPLSLLGCLSTGDCEGLVRYAQFWFYLIGTTILLPLSIVVAISFCGVNISSAAVRAEDFSKILLGWASEWNSDRLLSNKNYNSSNKNNNQVRESYLHGKIMEGATFVANYFNEQSKDGGDVELAKANVYDLMNRYLQQPSLKGVRLRELATTLLPVGTSSLLINNINHTTTNYTMEEMDQIFRNYIGALPYDTNGIDSQLFFEYNNDALDPITKLVSSLMVVVTDTTDRNLKKEAATPTTSCPVEEVVACTVDTVLDSIITVVGGGDSGTKSNNSTSN